MKKSPKQREFQNSKRGDSRPLPESDQKDKNQGEDPTPLRYQKPKHFRASAMKLIRYLSRDRWEMGLALLAASVATVLSLFGPAYLKDMTNEIMKALPVPGNPAGLPVNFQIVGSLALKILLFYCAGVFLQLIQTQIMVGVSGRLMRRMRQDLLAKVNRMPLSYFDHNSYGDFISRITNDVDILTQVLLEDLSQSASTITMLIGVTIMMFYYAPILALCALASSVLGFLMVSLIVGRTQKYFTRQQKLLGDLNGRIEEVYSGHTVVRANQGVEEEVQRFLEINEALYDSAWKSRFLSGLMMPVMNFVGNLGYVAVCIVGAVLAAKGSISFGIIVAFIVYVRNFSSTLSKVTQILNDLQMGLAAGERVFDFWDEEELSDESAKTRRLENVRGDVSFQNLQFGYLPDQLVLRDFSAEAKAGQKIAIVGPTGAGKTTIVNLLMRFYELNSGQILIDGTPIQTVSRENLHDQFAMVLQDSWIFDGTIRENIVFNRSDISDEEIEKACRSVGLHHFISTLPHDYDEELNEHNSLSEGQKQLLCIARAMLRHAPLLIFDEATSSVDTRTERRVQEAMDQLTEGRTSFVIAHRLSTIKNADLIFVLQDGDIVEQGRHEELLAQNGFYAELYRSQFDIAGHSTASKRRMESGEQLPAGVSL